MPFSPKKTAVGTTVSEGSPLGGGKNAPTEVPFSVAVIALTMGTTTPPAVAVNSIPLMLGAKGRLIGANPSQLTCTELAAALNGNENSPSSLPRAVPSIAPALLRRLALPVRRTPKKSLMVPQGLPVGAADIKTLVALEVEFM